MRFAVPASEIRRAKRTSTNLKARVLLPSDEERNVTVRELGYKTAVLAWPGAPGPGAELKLVIPADPAPEIRIPVKVTEDTGTGVEVEFQQMTYVRRELLRQLIHTLREKDELPETFPEMTGDVPLREFREQRGIAERARAAVPDLAPELEQLVIAVFEAAQKSPEDPAGNRLAAEVLLDAGCTSLAGECATRALSLTPDDPDTNMLMARILMADGAAPLALKAAETAVRLAPDRTDLQEAAQALLEKAR